MPRFALPREVTAGANRAENGSQTSRERPGLRDSPTSSWAGGGKESGLSRTKQTKVEFTLHILCYTIDTACLGRISHRQAHTPADSDTPTPPHTHPAVPYRRCQAARTERLTEWLSSHLPVFHDNFLSPRQSLSPGSPLSSEEILGPDNPKRCYQHVMGAIYMIRFSKVDVGSEPPLSTHVKHPTWLG